MEYSQLTHYLPLYTRDHVKQAIPEYFEAPSRWSPYPSRTLIGTPRAYQVTESTTFVARIAHRKTQRYIKSIQRSRPGDRNHVYHRRYYKTSHYSYVVASVSWRDAIVTELAAFASKQEALNHLAKIV